MNIKFPSAKLSPKFGSVAIQVEKYFCADVNPPVKELVVRVDSSDRYLKDGAIILNGKLLPFESETAAIFTRDMRERGLKKAAIAHSSWYFRHIMQEVLSEIKEEKVKVPWWQKFFLRVSYKDLIKLIKDLKPLAKEKLKLEPDDFGALPNIIVGIDGKLSTSVEARYRLGQ